MGTQRLSWRDLQVVVEQAPPGSAIHRAVDTEAARWASGEVVPYVLAHIADLLAAGNWQRAGRKNAPKPKPLPRPGLKTQNQSFGSEPIPISEFDAWWNDER